MPFNVNLSAAAGCKTIKQRYNKNRKKRYTEQTKDDEGAYGEKFGSVKTPKIS